VFDYDVLEQVGHVFTGVGRFFEDVVDLFPLDHGDGVFLFVEELPDQTTATPNAVAIRTKVGIPVFVRPIRPLRSATVESVIVEGGKVLTRVRNTGNLHLSVDGVTVRGTNASGAQTFSGEAKGWYVLPGATRVFELPVATTACAATTSVSVEVTGHGKSLPGNGAVPAGACTAR